VEIKECPFCGEIPSVDLAGGWVPMVSCPTEGCIFLMDDTSPFCDDVVKRWNTRRGGLVADTHKQQSQDTDIKKEIY
jgi:hypothetical protein